MRSRSPNSEAARVPPNVTPQRRLSSVKIDLNTSNSNTPIYNQNDSSKYYFVSGSQTSLSFNNGKVLSNWDIRTMFNSEDNIGPPTEKEQQK